MNNYSGRCKQSGRLVFAVVAILNRKSQIAETHFESRNAETRIAEMLNRMKREPLNRETLLCETRDWDTSALKPQTLNSKP